MSTTKPSNVIKSKFFRRMALGTAALSILGLIAVFVIANTVVRDAIYDNVLGIAQREQTIHAGEIDAWFGTAIQTIDNLANFMRAMPTDTDFTPILERFTQEYYFIDNIFVGFPDGRTINGRGWIPDEGWSLFDRPWYIAARAAGDDELVILDAFWSYSGQVVAAALSIWLPDVGEEGAIMGFSVTLENILEQVSRHQIMGDGYLILIGANGQIITHPDPFYSLGPDVEVINIRDYDDGLIMQNISVGVRFARIDDTRLGSAYFIATPLTNVDWTLIAIIPTDTTENIITDSLMAIMISFSALLIVVFVVSMVFASRITKSEALNAQERDVLERWNLVNNASPIAVNFWDEHLNFLDCNEMGYKMFGYDSKEEWRDNWQKTAPEIQPDGTLSMKKFADAAQKAISEGYERFEWLHNTKDGEPLPLDITLARVKHMDSVMIVAFLQDLRQLREANTKLHEEAERTQHLLDACPLAVSIFDEQWNEIYCNRTTVEVFGLEDYDLSKPPDFFVHEDQPDGATVDEIYKMVREEVAKHGEYRGELLLQKVDGTPMPTDATYLRLDYDDHYIIAAYYRDLTEEKAIREREREVNELNEIFMKNAPLIMNIWDDTKTLIATTPQAAEIFEFDSTQQFIERFFDLSPKKQPCGRSSKELTEKLLSQAFDSGFARFEWLHQKLDGEPIPTDVTLHRFIRDGKPFLATFAVDLRPTKALHAKEAMELANQRMTAMLNASPLASFVLSEDFEVLELNQEAISLFGAKNKQDFIENFIRTAPQFQPDGEPSAKRMGELMASSMEYIRTEWTSQTFQGEQFPCELHATRFFSGGEKMAIVYMRDLREFNAFKEMSERTQLMFDATPLIAELWDKNYEAIDCSKTALDFYGFSYKLEYLLFLQERKLKPPDESGIEHRDKWNAHLKEIFENGFGHFEWLEPKPDGGVYPLEVEGIRMKNNNEDVVITYSRDVTELKKLQKEQEELMQKLEAASNAKSKFLSNMSHEIRTPMSAIIGMTGIAKSTDDIDRMSDCIVKIEKASKHLLGIINQILDISKIEAEQFKLDSHKFQFEKMVDEVINVVSVSIEEKSLVLDVDLDKNIPKYIVSDEIRLAQVLTNLLINAVKFTPEDGRVSLVTKLLPDSIMRVEVTDTGIGIPKVHHSALFDPFVQVEMSATRSFAGTGLGLPISKKIVEMMGGEIWLESEPGKGSCFIFEIPIKAGRLAEEDSLAEITDGIELDLYKDYTILIAEDMEINLEIVCALLEPTGIKIECATDGVQAVQMFRDNSENYDLILMDIQMPKMDGLTATRIIRELDTKKSKSIPIVAMTANVFREDIDKCLEAGMNDHLSKPLDWGQVMEILRLYL